VAVRNAVLAILVEIIQWQKGEIDAGRTTEDDCKQLRNKIMVHIEDFICDVNAVVRSKVRTGLKWFLLLLSSLS